MRAAPSSARPDDAKAHRSRFFLAFEPGSGRIEEAPTTAVTGWIERRLHAEETCGLDDRDSDYRILGALPVPRRTCPTHPAGARHDGGPGASLRDLPRGAGARDQQRLLPAPGRQARWLSLQPARRVSGRPPSLCADELPACLPARSLPTQDGRVLRRAAAAR